LLTRGDPAFQRRDADHEELVEVGAEDGQELHALYRELTRRELTREFGEAAFERIDAPATPAQKVILARLSPRQVTASDLAGGPITSLLTTAPGNGAPFGGLKVVARSGWFAARPSGTENVYKLYVESFKGRDHLRQLQEQAQAIIQKALKDGAAR